MLTVRIFKFSFICFFYLVSFPASAFPNKIEVQKLKDTKSHTFLLNEFKQTTALFFWASWCTYCKEVLPELDRMQKINPNLRVIGISVDENKKDAVRANLKEYGVILRQYWVGPKFLEELKIKTIPLVVLIDKSGNIDTIYEGSKADKIHYLKKRVSLLINPSLED